MRRWGFGERLGETMLKAQASSMLERRSPRLREIWERCRGWRRGCVDIGLGEVPQAEEGRVSGELDGGELFDASIDAGE